MEKKPCIKLCIRVKERSLGFPLEYGAAGPLEAGVLSSHTGAAWGLGLGQEQVAAYSRYLGSNFHARIVASQSNVGVISYAHAAPGDNVPPTTITRKTIVIEKHLLIEKNPVFKRLKIFETLRRLNFTLQSNGVKSYLPSICTLLFKQFGPFESPPTVQAEYPR
ncbi:MAG: hypothetical protein GXP52_08605 [Deltaproteobacteria bacterium]|nr:hypothetical protein [Deltaproteobacteria bacterium]